MFVIHQPTNGKPVSFFFVERYDRYNDPKKYKSDHILSEKKERGRVSVCLRMRFKYEVNFQIETPKIERGIAVRPLVFITTCSMYRNRFLVVSLDG